MGEREEPRVEVRRDRCPYCHDDVPATPERVACSACGAWHHQPCWEEGRACSACGFAPAAPPKLPGNLRCDGAGRCAAPPTDRVGLTSVYCPDHAREALRLREMILLFAGLVALPLFSVLFFLEGPHVVEIAITLGGLACFCAVLGWRARRQRRALARRSSRTPPRPDRAAGAGKDDGAS